jgi:hypothetical protein
MHILCFLYFSDNRDEVDKTDENYDRLWKVQAVFEIVNETITKFYCPSKHLAVDEIVFLLEGRVVFRQYIPNKHKRFGIKLYKLYDSPGFTCNMKVYLGNNKQYKTQDFTVT